MSKHISTSSVELQTEPSHGHTTEGRPVSREALIDAIEVERQRIFRARAISQTAAKLLHELYINERQEPDIGFVLDVVSDLLESLLAGLDRVTLSNL